MLMIFKMFWILLQLPMPVRNTFAWVTYPSLISLYKTK